MLKFSLVVDECVKFSKYLAYKHADIPTYKTDERVINKINQVIYKECNRYFQILSTGKNISPVIKDRCNTLIENLTNILMYNTFNAQEDYYDYKDRIIMKDELQVEMINFYTTLYKIAKKYYLDRLLKTSNQFKNESSDILNLILDGF